MSAVMFGNGASGIGSNILRGATLAIWPASESTENGFRGTMALYTIAFLFQVACALAQFFLDKNEFACYYLGKT